VLLALGLTSAAPAAAPAPATASGAAPSAVARVGTEQVLFRSGTDGYGCFRIPALVKTTAGSLLAFAEGRKTPSCADRADIDIVVRRSTNGGRTWGPIQVVLAGKGTDPNAPMTRGNPAPVVDRSTGQIFLLSTSNEQTPTGQRLPWVQHSDDDGLTWSAAAPVAATFSGANNGWFATGPSHGIQLTTGPQAGWLVVGAHQSPNSTTTYDGVLYSDNHGETWKASTAANSFVDGVTNPGEVSVAELPDGSVYAAARNNVANTTTHRTSAVSTDGGATMPAMTTVPSLVTPDVQGTVLTLRQTYQRQPGDTMIFSAPSDPTNRALMKIRYSTDRGVTWNSPTNGLIANTSASYSDLAELDDGEIGLLYEGGPTLTAFSADEIRFNRFTPAQIGLPGTFTGAVFPQVGPAASAATPDATAEANDAYLRGDATLGSGYRGQGLVLNGTGDYVDVPYATSLDPGAGDFTYSTWFKYVANGTTPQQVIFWGYGVGTGKPAVWLRAQPASDRLYAWVEGTGGPAYAAVTDTSGIAFGDNAWHHVSLVRTGGQIQLYVTTATGAVVTGSSSGVVSGSVSGSRVGGVEGLRLGAKEDATASDPFTGTIDEFRFYRRALTTGQLDQLRGGSPDILDGDPAAAVNRALGVRLPFQVVDGAVTASRISVAITDDNSGHCAAGTLLGGKQSAAGRIGSGAIKVSSAYPGAEVPFLPTLDVGSGNFTFTTWFQYSANDTTAQQALVWAYGSTAGQRSVWIRAQPGQDRLYAWVQTDTAQVAVALPDDDLNRVAFGDNAWHALALTRTGSQIQLSVDGVSSAPVTGLTGTLTANQAGAIEGLRLGSKPGGSDIMQGQLDEFRLYRRALSATELDAIAAGASQYPGDMPALWWSFEHQYTQVHDVAWPAPATGPATPDSSVHCDHAYVRGGATPAGGGAFGSALAFDGVDDAVQIPYASSNALGSADFTISTWVNYSATASSPDQVIFWGYGAGASERQVWLRVQPSKDRLLATLETDTASTQVAGQDGSIGVAFGDRRWHHVVLERSGGQLLLLVDGVNVGSGDVPAGSVTYGDAFAMDGFQLGAKPDGTGRFKGSLDEFRIIRKAVTAQELDGLRAGNTDPGPATGVWLPFDVVTANSYARM
jgi:sialidase-1